MAMKAYKKDNVVLSVLEGSVLEKEVIALGYTAGGTTIDDYDAVPELSQQPIFVKSSSDKATLEDILAELQAGTVPPTP